MATIEWVELRLVDIPPKVKRTNAIQSFVSQETPIVTIRGSDGAVGTGYSYTIGTGGSSVMRLIADHLAPRLIGRDAERIEAIWRELEFATHATTIGAISALALAAFDTALWDLRCKRLGLPLWIVASAADRRPLYTTEGGWLHIDERALVDDAIAAREQGFTGSKVKVGRPRASEDYRRLAAVRSALGPDYEIMTDANQGFALDEAIRRAGRFADLDLAWIEEPLPADDCDGHVRLCQRTTTPIAIGESMCSIRHFREFMARGACSIVQVDVARIGGITPWLKVAHAAEAFDMPVCPHFLMELHLSLACAVQNGKYVEYIPQLDELTTSRIKIERGMALAPSAPGIGVQWDLDKVKARASPSSRRHLEESDEAHGHGDRHQAGADRRIQKDARRGVARGSGQDFRLQPPQLHDLPEGAGGPPVRLLGVSRRRLGGGRRQDGGRPEDARMVGDSQTDAGPTRQPKGRRLVGYGGGGVPPRLSQRLVA
jgi:L-alanine-DL-glutamate epimerase-like enolase superfamily enzyme